MSKTRIDAGTDIAMIGAWDVSRNDGALTKKSGKQMDQILDADCAVGHLFVIHTGADGGGPIDIYVDESVPEQLRQQCRAVRREFWLSLPTGRLIVGGVEDYRSDKPQIISAGDVVTVSPGDYALRCYVPKEETSSEPPTRAELEAAIGVEDYSYYRRIQNIGLIAYFGVPLLFIGLWIAIGWKKGLIIAVPIGLISYVFVRLISANDRFRRVSRQVNELWKKAFDRGLPTFALELRKAADATSLKGGSLRLNT